jgi:hypothetical protein
MKIPYRGASGREHSDVPLPELVALHSDYDSLEVVG